MVRQLPFMSTSPPQASKTPLTNPFLFHGGEVARDHHVASQHVPRWAWARWLPGRARASALLKTSSSACLIWSSFGWASTPDPLSELVLICLNSSFIQIGGDVRSLAMITLCIITQAFITFHVCSWDYVRAGYLTIANQDCSIPNIVLTFFLQLTYREAK
jgi:hypothetical protein